MVRKSYQEWLNENAKVLLVEDVRGLDKYLDEPITKSQFLDGLRDCSYVVQSFKGFEQLFSDAI